MVAVKLSAFGGRIPAQDDTLLPENNSADNTNVFLDAGSLQGMRVPRVLHTMSNPAYGYAFRLPLLAPDRNHMLSSFWLEFPSSDTNVLRSPVANDAFERYYFAAPNALPRYNTRARILAASAPFTLGIPTPESAPTVVVAGGSATNVARAYVTTWVSAYGEEGPPSPPLLHTDHPDGTWNLTIPAPLSGDTTNRNLTLTRVYRTITGTGGGTTYYLLTELSIATLTYADNTTDLVLSNNALLESYGYSAPPTDLQGIVSMPNGMMVGWRGNEVWFCEPFLPHAWPAAYTLSIDAKIVGLGVVGQTLVICTDGYPYAATGVSPANMASSKIATFEPCSSRASIISTALGVLYGSPNGIQLAAYGVVTNATAQLATKDKWAELVRPETLRASRLGPSYYAWGTIVPGSFDPVGFEPTVFEQFDYTNAYTGISINLSDQRITWANMENAGSTTNVMTDVWSGEIFLMRDNQVVWLDPTTNAVQGPYRWRSKQFQLQSQQNLAAARVWFDKTTANDPTFVQNPVRDITSPQELKADQYGLLRVFVSGKLVMTRELRTSGELFRLPSGFKDVFWQFEIEARMRIMNFEVASTIKELAGV
jgi:hypothetical protein